MNEQATTLTLLRPLRSWDRVYPLLRYLLLLVVIALAIVGSGTWAVSMGLPQAPSFAIWWPSGIAVGAMLVFGYRVWPGIVAGCLIFTSTSTEGMDFGAAIADLSEAISTTFLTRYFLGKANPLRKATHLFKFFFLAAVCGPVIGSTIGWGFGQLTARWDGTAYEWFAWVLENMVAIMILSPTLISWCEDFPNVREIRLPRLIEAAFLGIALVSVGEIVFGNWFPLLVRNYPLEFLCTPFLAWASLRFGSLGASSAVTLLTIICLHGTANGFGPFGSMPPLEAIHLIQTYVATNALLCLLTAGIVAEREAANLRLSRSNIELQRFAYLASHDLQEPLRTISSFCTLIQRQCRELTNAQLDEYTGLVVGAAKRMHELINSLLDYSRVGKKVSIQRVDVTEIIETVLQNLRATILETKAEVRYLKLPLIQADPNLLALLFQNLISNAIKFNASQPPKVWVSGAQIRDQWHFKVEDNGIGIDPQYFEKIFRLFERLIPSSSPYPGTGLGLAVCKKIVEEHGGRIWVESTSGSGASFYFTLPKECPGGAS
jgi:signal transduction histidine kinase